MTYDPVAAAQRRIQSLKRTGEISPERVSRKGDGRHSLPGNPEWVNGNAPKRTKPHECDRGGRLNGWPICWRCYVDVRLAENGAGAGRHLNEG